MALKKFKPFTPSRRFYTSADFSEITKDSPEKSLVVRKSKSGGRNHHGRATNCNIGRGHKRRYRLIDFRRDKLDTPAKVIAVEYDPNRTARIALVQYADGEKRYIIAPIGLNVGQEIVAGENVEIRIGNALPLRKIPAGEAVHNIALKKGGPAQIARSAGVSAQVAAKEGEYALLRMPSGEMRKVHIDCYATVGAVGNTEHINQMIGKAGRSRWLGIRPHNRGVSKNPVDHPLGGGEGKSKGGRHPCSRTGQKAKGLKTRTNKRTQKFIVRRRSVRTEA